ncbi:N-acetyl-gamma-glutamyl-phosphate reductase [Spirochaetota bacterium]
MKNVTIIGASGFGGVGLIGILLNHPEFKIKQLIDKINVDEPISNIYPYLKGFCDIPVTAPEKTDYKDIDLAFFSTPDQVGMTIIQNFYDNNIPVIDFSGDFRFNSMDDYGVYAANKGMSEEHHSAELLSEAVYGLPEKNFQKINNARIVGNPGCFAIGMILGLLPAVEENIVDADTIICDGKSGVSGAGKSSGEANLYPQRYENSNTYREGKHQHLVEVENIINIYGKEKRNIFFVPQVIPQNRGILMNIYCKTNGKIDNKKILNLYNDYYNKMPFVEISDLPPNTSDVRGSNKCKIRPLVDERTNTILITSVIDNLMKGQAGNAVQNANIMMGFDETLGLNLTPFYP